MAKRLWEYNVIASCKFDRPIYSVVLFLKKGKITTASPYIVNDHSGAEIHRFQFTVIKLWELPTEMLFENHFQGLLPLAPLTRDGKHYDVVEKVITSLLDGNADKDLLSLTYGLSALAFNKKEDKEWLKRRFRMLDEILNDTWAFKELRKRGRDEGRQEGRQEVQQKERQADLNILVSFVQTHFPTLMPLTEECKHVITSNKTVKQLVLKVGLAQSEDEARQHLLKALKK
jgi:predicted transposase YdaD